DPSTTSHKRIRDEAEKCYINTAERQLNKYNRGLKKQKLYQINDIVGLKIADVDRTNTSASTLPCKIIQIIEKDDSSTMFYQVATLDGIIKELFLSIAFVDLSQTVAADLRQLITTNLPLSHLYRLVNFLQITNISTHVSVLAPVTPIGVHVKKMDQSAVQNVIVVKLLYVKINDHYFQYYVHRYL
ncbi:unnamed protein product, partial [Rotaria socialis]